MRTHLQGTFLLIVLLLMFWGMLRWAVPIIDDAIFGGDGAIVARAPQNLIDLNDPDALARLEANRPLERAEVADLQEVLLLLGYNPGPVDGIMGELTRAAMEQAKADVGFTEESDRQLLESLEALEAEQAAANPLADTNIGAPAVEESRSDAVTDTTAATSNSVP